MNSPPKSRNTKQAQAPDAQSKSAAPGLVFRDFVRLLEQLAGGGQQKARSRKAPARRSR